MKVPFHYLVKARVITIKEDNEPEFQEIEKVFKNENPIEAREEAFSFYQNWIDILLEYKGEQYISDKIARRELFTFIEHGRGVKLTTDTNEIKYDRNSYGNGIGVYFVVNEKANGGNWSCHLEPGEELLIHGIGNLCEKYMNESYVIDRMIISLSQELEFYKHFKFDTKGLEQLVTYCMWMVYHDGDMSVSDHKILKTPFDWTGYDKPFWWGASEIEDDLETEEVSQVSEPLTPYVAEKKSVWDVIQGGESNSVEFKPALVYNFNTGKGGIGIKEIIAKSICGFLNSKGGILFIGVNDDKTIQGLEFDFSLANGKDELDFFQLEFDQMVEHFLGNSVRWNITSRFHKIEEKMIFEVEVFPFKNRPVFLKGRDGKEFYIRGEASTRKITDIEEILSYCIERSNNKK